MTYSVQIFDWRASLKPAHQLFRAGGVMQQGGLTIGGARVGNPEPGGVAELMLGFAALGRREDIGRDVSWTVSRILNRNVMRIRLCVSPQLVSAQDLGGAGLVDGGLPWSNEELWANGEPWGWSPTAPVSQAASRGASEVSVDLADYGEVLQVGHVIGFTIGGYDFAHIIMDISYGAGDVATMQVQPPLRRAVTTDDVMRFRPSMLVTCANAREVAALFEYRSYSSLGQATMVEALV